MTKGASSKKKNALYVNHWSLLGVMWKYARQCKESQACRWYGKALTPDRAAVPLSVCPSENTQRERESERERERGRERWEQREGWVDRQRTKRRVKGRRVWCKQRKDGDRRNKPLGGDRCLEAMLETEGWGGGEPGRRMKRTPAACPSQTPVSDSSALPWAQWERPRSAAAPRRTSSLTLLHISAIFSTFSLRKQTGWHANLTHIHTLANPHPRLPSALTLSLPLSHSLGAIFTSKRLHYLPSLRAIRNGVTLSGRHGHGFITTHPLSWGPLWGPPTLMERILGSQLPPPTPPHTPGRPLLLTGKLWSKMVCN